jgi:hypothetical protein
MIYGQHDKTTGMYAFENFELERLDELLLEPQEVREASIGHLPNSNVLVDAYSSTLVSLDRLKNSP